jgi:hypothetical protein
MPRALIDPEYGPVRNALGCLAAAVMVPAAMLAVLVSRILGIRQPDLSAAEVAAILRGFLDGSGGPYDFDDFISAPHEDPRLDLIRNRAAALALPVDEESLAALRALLAEAEEIAAGEG